MLAGWRVPEGRVSRGVPTSRAGKTDAGGWPLQSSLSRTGRQCLKQSAGPVLIYSESFEHPPFENIAFFF